MSLLPRSLATASVERVISAPAEKIFELLADPSRHPEIDGSGTVKGAVEGSRRLQLGDEFGMDMRIGGPYQMTNRVVELEPDRRIAWQGRPTISAAALVLGGRIWRYELEPVPGGTRVRETWDLTHERTPFPLAMRSITKRNMERTLKRIEVLVTGDAA